MITLSVCGVAEVPQFVNANLTDMVSIGDPDTHPELCPPQPPPDFAPFPTTRIHRFEFQDIGHIAPTSPTAEHVKRLIEIADAMIAAKEDIRVLFHCQAGISRSTAAAFIFLVRAGLSYQDAYDYILQRRGILMPNAIMIKHADILMNQGGKMLDFIASFRPDVQAWVKVNGYTFN